VARPADVTRTPSAVILSAAKDLRWGDARGMRDYYVYIMTNKSRTLYAGVTNDLERRVYEHKQKLVPGFTSKYNINFLVWYDTFANVEEAIQCEKRIKGWLRAKKIALVESKNPTWHDLSDGWPGSEDSSLRSE
jgi:putative endonuclease